MKKKNTSIALLITFVFCFAFLNVFLNAQKKTCTITVTAEKERGEVRASAKVLRKVIKDRLGFKIERWEPVETLYINGRYPVVSTRVEPGVYKIHFRCTFGSDSEEFTLKGNDSHSITFRLGTIKITAEQDEGYIDGTAQLFKKIVWDEAGLKRERWKLIANKEFKKGVLTWDVAPGIYQVRFLQEETRARVEAKTTEVLHFDVGYIHIIATLQKQEKVLSRYGEIYKKAEKDYLLRGNRKVKKGEWRRLTRGNILMYGETKYPVLPGEYKVVVEVLDRKKESRIVTVGPKELKKVVI